MIDVPAVRRFAPDEWRAYRDLRLGALADAPDAFGSTLAHEIDRTDGEWSSRLAAGAQSASDLPLVAEVGGEPIGLAWGRIESDPDIATLYQMWVAPKYRGLGVGRMLVEAVIAWATARDARYLTLSVTCDNSPARRLYERAGFLPIGESRPLRHGSELQSQPMALRLERAG